MKNRCYTKEEEQEMRENIFNHETLTAEHKKLICISMRDHFAAQHPRYRVSVKMERGYINSLSSFNFYIDDFPFEDHTEEIVTKRVFVHAYCYEDALKFVDNADEIKDSYDSFNVDWSKFEEFLNGLIVFCKLREPEYTYEYKIEDEGDRKLIYFYTYKQSDTSRRIAWYDTCEVIYLNNPISKSKIRNGVNNIKKFIKKKTDIDLSGVNVEL